MRSASNTAIQQDQRIGPARQPMFGQPIARQFLQNHQRPPRSKSHFSAWLHAVSMSRRAASEKRMFGGCEHGIFF